MKSILFILICFFGGFGFSQQMRIGIFHSQQVKTLSISVHEGSYQVFGDTVSLGALETIMLEYKSNGVAVTSNGVLRVYSKISVVEDTVNCAVQLKSINPASKSHLYRDNFEITRGAKGLRIVNLVGINNYLTGVIESEGGGGRHLEYYKVQALMSRTYALKNLDRHEKDGYELCDGVHCQAYHNMLRYTPLIETAVEATTGLVLVDEKNTLVTTYFSANCGGQVCDASYVWNTSVPYVKPFIDTFCIHTKQATWTKTIDKYVWRNYMRDQFGVTETQVGDLLYTYNQENRSAFYLHPSLGIPLRDLREKFGLKSTYFSTHLEGEKVVLEGRGFGHGVGLCQEGAMEMAKSGYDFTQIARFYFYNVTIIDANRLQFFKQTISME